MYLNKSIESDLFSTSGFKLCAFWSKSGLILSVLEALKQKDDSKKRKQENQKTIFSNNFYLSCTTHHLQ